MAINLIQKIKQIRRLNSIERKRLFLRSIGSLTMSKPNVVAIEATPYCNAQCIFCDVNWQKAKIPSGYMNEETLEKILPILTKETSVIFSNSGECFLHKDYGQMLRKLKERAKMVITLTNGQTLNKSLIEELIEYGLDELRVSIHAAHESTYQNIYRAGSLAKVIDNLNLLNELKIKNRTKFPALRINIVAIRENIEEIPQIVKLAGELKAVYVNVGHVIVPHKSIREQNLFYHQKIAKANFKKAKKIAEKLGIPISLPVFSETRTECSSDFFNHIFITWDGLVFSCSMERHYYGDLKEESIEKIWNGRRIKQLRKMYYQKGIDMVCPRCPGWHKGKESLVDFYYPKESIRFCGTGIN